MTPTRGLFDPESKVKFMLNGLANIYLRPDMEGMITDYQQKKIGKYEIPISSLSSSDGDAFYSNQPRGDSEAEKNRVEKLLADTAREYDKEVQARARKNTKPKKPHPLTRRQKIEAVRKEYGIQSFSFERVNTENEFEYCGDRYLIGGGAKQYEPHPSRGGELVYDMDKVICAETTDGRLMFFDMSVKNISSEVKKCS